MRSILNGITVSVLFILTTFSLLSCSEEETRPDPTRGLIRVADVWAAGAATRAEIWAAEPIFTGYNKITFLLYDSLTGQALTDAQVSVMPLMQMADKSHSCPVENPVYEPNAAYKGAIIFTMPSGDAGTWTLHLKVQRKSDGKTGEASIPVTVEMRSPSPLIIFKTVAEEKFVLAAHFAERARIGTNPLELIVFRAEGHSFVPAEGLNFTIRTEMPSMDHGSPNNISPIHERGGHYKGQVNFTMSGDWRIHLQILTNGASLGEKYFDVLVN